MLHEHGKLAAAPKDAAKNLGIGVTKLYEEIKAGRLRALKFGNRTLITAEAQKEWLNSLPQIGGNE
jgi:excisionase family DNA binding protein